ncbi:hypothetical protein AX17_001592 [Amanita inopinata Kibby_2008]|nr:hypothetical protein AX17_001592 [Amanita inopinata Kibby_2008]
MDHHVIAIALTTSIVIGAAIYFTLHFSSRNPLNEIAGPPLYRWFDNHLRGVLDPSISPRVHEHYIRRYGRSIRIRGIGFWDQRLLTLDPVTVSYILRNTTTYQKPWQSRKLITSLIGCGMLAAEGQVHKRHRRVVGPAFSIQNLRSLIPLVFHKGVELKDKWLEMINMQSSSEFKIDVCHWVSRATFDVIGIAGFDYNFNAIQDDSNELFAAYKEMFECSISQGRVIRTLFSIYLPWFHEILPDTVSKTVRRCQATIHRVAGQLILEKKRKMSESQSQSQSQSANAGLTDGRDLLSLLLKSNSAADLLPEQRISDEDILHNINTFMFAGSDTSSLTLTWTLLLLAQHPDIQDRLRSELLSIAPKTSTNQLSDEEVQSLYSTISTLPHLHNVTRESIRLIPPVHSSIRVATRDDEVPTAYPVHNRDGSLKPKNTVAVAKGTLIHVAIEGFNLDKDIWGDDAWEYK